MANESTTQRQIWLELGGNGITTLFRLNTGKGWLSGIGPKGVHRLKDGSIHIEAPRPIALGFGLVNGDPVVGACDLPGWTVVEITHEMVGSKVPVFTSIETKRTTGGKVSDNQNRWLSLVRATGGIAGVANSPESARKILEDWFSKFKAS